MEDGSRNTPRILFSLMKLRTRSASSCSTLVLITSYCEKVRSMRLRMLSSSRSRISASVRAMRFLSCSFSSISLGERKIFSAVADWASNLPLLS